VDPELLNTVLAAGELPLSDVGEHLTEATRLIAKRFFTLIVDDKDVPKAVDAIITANQTGNPGDGRIFVLPISEAYTVRSGEPTIEAY
jgi:nitrogen regulatory protein PII 2